MNAFEQYQSQRYFKSLDGVRFLSIIAVIWHHSFPEGLPEIFSRGFLGVDMFFVLSGYLIVTLLLREKQAHQSISLKNFYIRRALRIFPIYFGVLFALAAIYGILKSGSQSTEEYFSLLPFYLFFLVNWSVHHVPILDIYWSLATEEQFYLFWPFFEKVFQAKVIYTILGLFLVFNQLINFGVLDDFIVKLYGTEEALALNILDSTFTPITLGVILAHLLHHKNTFVYIDKFLGNHWASLVIFLFLLLTIYVSRGDISGVERLSIQLLMFVWLASLVVREGHVFEPFMTLYPVKRIGQISYGMYVYHLFALHIAKIVLERIGLTDFGVDLFLATTIITFIAAEISFRLYEKPILSLSKRFQRAY
jgi:peptidoglycan/LPS O-acetylase OafA/YrhL